MADPEDPTPAPPADPPADPPPADPPADDPPEDPPELGDAGKRAIQRERENAKAARAEAKKLSDQLDALKAEQMTESEKALEAARAEGRTEAMIAANTRIVETEIKAAAAEKVAAEWRADLPKLLDLESFIVDGEVDTQAIVAAIDALVETKPSLKAGTTPASPDGGPRGGGVQQVTRAELSTMSPEAIETARKEGRLSELLSGTTN